MKNLKIILVIIVLGGIGFFIFQSLDEKADEDAIKSTDIVAPVKGYSDRIEFAIDSLNKTDESILNKMYYKSTQGSILTYYKSKGLTESEKDHFSRKLLEAYSNNLIVYAKYKFNQEIWKGTDLKKIKNELEEIRKSEYLGSQNNIVNQLDEIDVAINKYNEINIFIYSTMTVSTSIYSTQETVSTAVLQDKLNKANLYLSNNLENEYVDNCTDLKDRLRKVPENLLNSNINYLTKKVNHWAGMYKDTVKYPIHRAYANKIFIPLKSEIKLIEEFFVNKLKSISVDIINSKFDILFDTLQKDSHDAYVFYSTP